MSQIRRLILALAAVAALGGMTVSAAGEGSDLTITGQVDWASKHIYRGVLVNDNAVLTPSLTLGMNGIEAKIFGVIDTDNAYNREDNFQWVEATLDYTQALDETFSATGGILYRDFPGQGANATSELYVKLAAAVAFNPVLAVYYDFDEIDGWYVNLGASHTIALADVHENLDLILAANVGWASEDYIQAVSGVNDSALVAISPSAALKYTASEKLSFAWYINYDYLLDNDVRNAAQAGNVDSSNFSFGTNVAYTF
jgi:hypothetical protein